MSKAKQIRRYFCKKEDWLKVKVAKKDQSCRNCGSKYSEIADTHVGLGIFEGEPNKHMCLKCCEKFIAEGGADMDKAHEDYANEKAKLIAEIREMEYYEIGFRSKKLDELKVDELKNILSKLILKKEAEDELRQLINEEFVDTPIEPYLIEDWGVIEFKDLRHHRMIEEWFKDCGSEYFDCGQGYYEDELSLIVKIGTKFYDVKLKAEIYSDEQDKGDRLYWVERIEKVEYTEIEKPQPKKKETYSIEVTCTHEKYLSILKFINQ